MKINVCESEDNWFSIPTILEHQRGGKKKVIKKEEERDHFLTIRAEKVNLRKNKTSCFLLVHRAS